LHGARTGRNAAKKTQREARNSREASLMKFMFLTYGFEKPTPEIMRAWGEWFGSIKDRVVEKGHFPRGREISKDGAKDLPLGVDSITGFVIIEAPSFEDAEKMAASNPYISSIRLYEMMSG
jgi:hypothetical protein